LSRQIARWDPVCGMLQFYGMEWDAANAGCPIGTCYKYGFQAVLAAAETGMSAVSVLQLAEAAGNALVGALENLALRRIPFDQRALTHIFRNADDYIPLDTPANRAVLQDTLRRQYHVYTNAKGVATYRRILPDGRQAWVEVFEGKMTNGGINAIPR
jgi:hypothetical protein